MRIDLKAVAAANSGKARQTEFGVCAVAAAIAFGSVALLVSGGASATDKPKLRPTVLAEAQTAPVSVETTLEAGPAGPEGSVAQVSADQSPAELEGQTAAAPSAPLGLVDYKLDRGDRIRVRFFDRFDRNDLNGDYTVGDNGQLRLPKLGALPAIGRTALDIEADIRKLLTNRKERPGFFIVEVVQTRPIFVTGLANKPGAYTYASGLTVLHAVSLAGGLYRSASSPDAEAVRESGRGNELKSRLEEQIAKRARLITQRAGRSKIPVPAELVRLNPSGAADIIEQEQAILDDLRDEKGNRRASLETIISLTQREISEYKRELANVNARIAERQKQTKSLRRLYKRGLTEQRRLDEVGQSLDGALRDRSVTAADLAQSRTALQKAQLELKELELVDGSPLGERISTADAEIARLKKGITDNGRLIGKLNQLAGSAASDAKVSYRIVRRSGNGATTTIQANEQTTVLPGDIIDIAIRTGTGSLSLN